MITVVCGRDEGYSLLIHQGGGVLHILKSHGIHWPINDTWILFNSHLFPMRFCRDTLADAGLAACPASLVSSKTKHLPNAPG